MSYAHPGRQLFSQLIRQPDSHVDLIRAALAIAWEDRGDVDLERTLRRLAHVVADVRRYVAPSTSVFDQATQVVDYLHHVAGFAGDVATYDDPINSYLHFVLERHRGLPITLSILMLHIGQELGLPFEASALPGHFMVRCTDQNSTLFLDLFNGRVLTSEECRLFLQAQLGYDIPDPARFQPPSRLQILARLLRNLKGSYSRRENYLLALAATERILLIDPGSGEDIRDRGLLRARLGDLHRALYDLEEYAQIEPLAGDYVTVQTYAQAIADTLSRRN